MITAMLLRGLDRRAVLFLIAMALIAVAVPVANLAFSPDHPLHVSTFYVTVGGKFLCYALLAVAIDLVWGFCGILSLGHAAFFGLGGYAMGMYLMRQIGDRGVYGHPELPDFMVFLSWEDLPWFWLGFDQFWFAMLMALVVPSLLAFAFGWFAFRSRVTGVYLSIITQAMTFALMLAFFRNEMGFGGNNGLTDFRDILGFDIRADETRAGLFVASAAALGLCLFLCSAVINSKLGKVLVGVRDAESRTRFLGYRVERYKLLVWTLSAAMAGLAGALYVPQVGIINPSEFQPANSIEAVIWVALGGRGTLVGPVIGAILVNIGKSFLTTAFPEVWLFALGALFVLTTLFLPRGVMGLMGRGRKGPPPEVPEPMPRAEPQPQSLGAAAAPTINRAPPKEDEEVALYLDGVSVSFDGFKALNDLSLVVEEGEMRAIIGPNGAGKTTLMDVVTGKTRPDKGTITFHQTTDLTRLDEAEIANLGIGRKFQKPTVFESHTVWNNIALALKAPRGPFATLVARTNTDERARIESVLDTIRLRHLSQRAAADLSHGQKQWLEIGMLIAQDPKILLVDEPAAGMTDAETAETARLLRRIAANHTVIVVEHDMDFIRDLDVKVTVLHEGAVLAEGTLDHVSADPRVIEVYLGRS